MMGSSNSPGTIITSHQIYFGRFTCIQCIFFSLFLSHFEIFSFLISHTQKKKKLKVTTVSNMEFPFQCRNCLCWNCYPVSKWGMWQLRFPVNFIITHSTFQKALCPINYFGRKKKFMKRKGHTQKFNMQHMCSYVRLRMNGSSI